MSTHKYAYISRHVEMWIFGKRGCCIEVANIEPPRVAAMERARCEIKVVRPTSFDVLLSISYYLLSSTSDRSQGQGDFSAELHKLLGNDIR